MGYMKALSPKVLKCIKSTFPLLSIFKRLLPMQ